MSPRMKTIMTGIGVGCTLLVIAICMFIYDHAANDAQTDLNDIGTDTQVYEVIYAIPETRAITNGFGGVSRTEPAWRFGYIDDDGELVEISDFYDSEAKCRHVIISEDDTARLTVEKIRLSRHWTLQLPKQWLEQLSEQPQETP